MRWPRPSLVRRLTLGFIAAQTIGLLLLFLLMLPLSRRDDVDQLGPDVALPILRDDLVASERGLALREGADYPRFAEASPRAWFIARLNGSEISRGTVPPEARRLFEALAPSVKIAELGNIGGTGRASDASLIAFDTDAGRVVVAAGGFDPSTVTLGTWLRHLHRESFTFVPIAFALLTLLGAIAAIPLILRSIRPTARAAAALDPSDLKKRLPEEKVVKELLPIVRAFNAALDRLEADFERRRRFIADIAHELRTPVAVLNMHVEDMPAGGAKADLQRGVFRLSQMIGQMLDAQRLALAGRQREPVDLVELSRAVAADVAPLAVAHGYEIAVTAGAPSVPVEGERHAIARALSNLLGNAIAHGGGNGTIEVSVDQAGRIDVCDEGPGVPDEARSRIFEPFRRERWDKDGCGLGLHLVREVMRAHGGEVALIGSGPGARFRLDFSGAGPAAPAG